MDITQMNYVLTLARILNFNKAASEMGISQPTLTYHIKNIESEIGFTIFLREGKNVSLTLAGEQFCTSLRQIVEEYKTAVERGQNLSGRYKTTIRIGLPMRAAIPKLPEAIRRFSVERPEVLVTTDFHGYGDFTHFLSGQNDMEFMLQEDADSMTGVRSVSLYRSGISLITDASDVLASKKMIRMDDLKGRRLMVGGGSPPALRKVQHRIVSSGLVESFNSPDHDTTLTNVAAGQGICLAPEFIHQEGDGFVWIPFDCEEGFDCVLSVREEHSYIVDEFADLLHRLSSENGYQQL
jgi:DNA-binding transcriptional LysR family regulator